MIKVVYPGSYDPVTLGHVDTIQRASELFDEVIALVVVNPGLQPAFTAAERAEMVRKSTEHIPNVKVDAYQGLLADYVREHKAAAIIKSLRAMSDFEHEFQMALTNKKLVPEADTVFLTTSIENMYLTSSLVKQVAAFSGDISGFVPKVVLDDINKRLSGKIHGNYNSLSF